jgi:O-antigen/teichoic acid export membrane protein
VPICVLLGVLAEPTIRLVYGAGWTAAATPLQFLVVLGLIRVAVDLAYDCLAARVRKTLMVMQGWWLAALIPALILFARHFGIVGIAAGHVLVAGLLVVPVFLVVLSKLGIRTRAVLAACARPLLGGVVMGVVAYGMHRLLGGGFLALVAIGIVALGVYVPIVLPFLRGAREREVHPGPEQDTGRDPRPVAIAMSEAE